MDPSVQEVLVGAILVGAVGYLIARKRGRAGSGCEACHTCEAPAPPAPGRSLPQLPPPPKGRAG